MVAVIIIIIPNIIILKLPVHSDDFECKPFMYGVDVGDKKGYIHECVIFPHIKLYVFIDIHNCVIIQFKMFTAKLSLIADAWTLQTRNFPAFLRMLHFLYLLVLDSFLLPLLNKMSPITLPSRLARVKCVLIQKKIAVHIWLMLTLMLIHVLCHSLQCGFFKRSKYNDSVPSYNAVRIKKEERRDPPGKEQPALVEKKQWMTTWNENESYS